jgi:ribonuclease HI
LKWLVDQNWQGELEIYGDSKLIINQLTQEWACNKLHLQKLRQRCWDLLEKLGNKYKATWIPREENSEADALTRESWESHTGRKFPERKKRRKK